MGLAVVAEGVVVVEGEGRGGSDIGMRSYQRWLPLRRAQLCGLQVEDEGGDSRGKKRKKMRATVGVCDTARQQHWRRGLAGVAGEGDTNRGVECGKEEVVTAWVAGGRWGLEGGGVATVGGSGDWRQATRDEKERRNNYGKW
ncbi:hypothetical protein GW17_00031704 [Ensete ventricosum]|nr:hypothetical protein GW17_00031704 [Ensete ventricosum]